MSLHWDCEKCGKYLGGIWPDETKDYEWNKENVYDPFFKQPNCEQGSECPHKEGL